MLSSRSSTKLIGRRKLFILVGLLVVGGLIVLEFGSTIAVKLHLVHIHIEKNVSLLNSSDSKKLDGVKVIYGATVIHTPTDVWKGWYDFRSCEYSNCVVQYSHDHEFIEKADIVLFTFNKITSYPILPHEVRQKQVWLVFSHESPGYEVNRGPSKVDGCFNGSMTYRTDSLVADTYGRISKRVEQPKPRDYSSGKTKAAYVYISNCRSVQYHRLNLVQQLKKYIDVDIYGKCTGLLPCPRADWTCEKRVHTQYYFYLSFENSLCKDYITEKFWARLQSDGIYLPVALGGLSVNEYWAQAPPDSFLHAYNFSSLESLANYMKYLMTNPEAYNRYHKWREQYTILEDRQEVSCRLCELANNKPSLLAVDKMSQWFNDEGSCGAPETTWPIEQSPATWYHYWI